MSTTYTVTLPEGQQVAMSSEPKVYQAGTHAWLTQEQADFTMQGLAVMLVEGTVVPVMGDGPNTGDMAFVLVHNGQPTQYAVFVVHQDGTAETVLPVNVAELKAHVMHGTDGNPHTPDETPAPQGEVPEHAHASAYGSDLGDYM